MQGLRRTDGRSEDMGGCGSTSRTRCRGPRPPMQAGGDCARGRAIRRRWLAPVSARGAKRRGRRRTRGTTEFLARWRSSGRCSCRWRRRGYGDRRRRHFGSMAMATARRGQGLGDGGGASLGFGGRAVHRVTGLYRPGNLVPRARARNRAVAGLLRAIRR